ncbi:HPF/RaiA family ribosome-associated protein [Candidatus Peregrinibacteria bacterium]|nr:HPF/RaiA family ribosome-associated protein [Candidatus Peregrinibacteria bacterium]
MNVQHFEKGLRYSDKDLLVLVRKIGKLATYCNRLKNEDSLIRVEAERRPTKKQRDQVKVMMTVELPRKILRAESRRVLPIDAVDRCIGKLEPQIKRYKEMHMGKGRARWRGE